MEYLILNESSIPFKTKADADLYFPVFLKIIESALVQGLKAIRVGDRQQNGWFNTLLTNEILINNWVAEQERDRRIQIKALIDKTQHPYIPDDNILLADRYDLSKYHLKSVPEFETPSLGACYLLKQVSVSYNSSLVWNTEKIEIYGSELTEQGDIPFETEVENCSTLEHWSTYEYKIKEEKKENLRKGTELWDNRGVQFPNLIFCGKTERQLKNLSVSDNAYNQLFMVLTQLNNYCQVGKNYALDDIKNATKLNMDDESDTVKQKPQLRRHRIFQINGVKTFFGLHVRILGKAFRLHFYPKKTENKIYVAYFGKHLPLK